MRRRNSLVAIALAALAAPAAAQEPGEQWAAPQPEEPSVDVSVDMAAPGAAVSFDTFHDALAPYGEWVVVAGYGRVWRPHVAVGWRPYYYGNWVWTDEGWLWDSDPSEPWGWGPYHYGRWAYGASYGWIWVPGYQWAPAWVSWRFGPEVIGWAPLAPGFSVYVSSYPAVFAAWTFVPCTRFVATPVYRVAYAPAYVPRLYHGTTPAPPRAVVAGAPAPAWGGPARVFVEQRIGRPIAPARIQPVASPAQVASAARGGAIPVYRPGAPRPAAPVRPGWGSPPRPGVARPGWSAPGGPGAARPAPRPGVPRQYLPPPGAPRPPAGAGGGHAPGHGGGHRGGGARR